MANTKTINTNMIAPGTEVTMQGKLDEFTYYLNHLLEGDKLKEQVSRQKAAGWKFPNTNPRSEFRLIDPAPVEGTDVSDENIKNLLTYLKESKVYTDKNTGVTTLTCVKNARVPLMGVLQENGRIKEVRPKGNLESGQEVQVTFQCYGTDKGNNGVSVNTVVFLSEPKEKNSLPNWDRMEKESDSAQASETATASQQAETPSETAPAGFTPAADEEIPW